MVKLAMLGLYKWDAEKPIKLAEALHLDWFR